MKDFEQIYIVACGSAWHVGMAAQYVLEDLADIPVRVELAALRLAKEQKMSTMVIENVVGISIACEADKVFYTLAGLEISVATTKAYSAQLAAKYANAHDVFFVGRGTDYAVSLEGSLKLKEISQIHSVALQSFHCN